MWCRQGNPPVVAADDEKDNARVESTGICLHAFCVSFEWQHWNYIYMAWVTTLQNGISLLFLSRFWSCPVASSILLYLCLQDQKCMVTEEGKAGDCECIYICILEFVCLLVRLCDFSFMYIVLQVLFDQTLRMCHTRYLLIFSWQNEQTTLDFWTVFFWTWHFGLKSFYVFFWEMFLVGVIYLFICLFI